MKRGRLCWNRLWTRNNKSISNNLFSMFQNKICKCKLNMIKQIRGRRVLQIKEGILFHINQMIQIKSNHLKMVNMVVRSLKIKVQRVLEILVRIRKRDLVQQAQNKKFKCVNTERILTSKTPTCLPNPMKLILITKTESNFSKRPLKT